MINPSHIHTTSFKRAKIALADTIPLAEGGGRRIYQHPSRPDIVIKIHKPFKPKVFQWVHTLLRKRKRRFGPLMHSFIEIEEVAAAVHRTGALPTFATQFMGFVPTDIGIGAMFEAITTSDGTLAPHLKDHATQFEPEIRNAIDALWDNIQASGIVVSDASLRNVVVTGQAPHYSLILIDGLGERTFIPILSLSKRAYQAACAKNRRTMQQAYTALTEHR